YGQMTGGWFSQVGDWREKADGAFFGGMAAFADKVRAKGMSFGVWIEPERFARGAPAVQAHPDWFCPSAGDGSFLYPDLDNGEAAAHVSGMISEVIDRYGAGWVKIDFNQTLGPDPRGRAHIGYTARLRRIADDLRAKYPDVVFECCAGGGFRLEAESQRFFDVTFPSDNVNPCDLLRIGEGAALRALSGRILRWCCLRGARLPKYLAEGGAGATLAPRKALWDQAETVDAEFALKVCLLGQLSFSGDLASLDGETKAKIAKAVDFAKKHRRFVQNGVTHPLTPAAPIEDRSGWSAAFVSDADATEGILYAFRLDSPEAERAFALPLAEWDGSYELTDYDTGESRRATWRALREAGAAVSIPARMRGSVWTVRRAKAQA
ncbi:MAG: alpha-galactosidase, partial [Clostridiales bacterium]|nr:alpha-galactosidase [Clostridiales bacterium]